MSEHAQPEGYDGEVTGLGRPPFPVELLDRAAEV